MTDGFREDTAAKREAALRAMLAEKSRRDDTALVERVVDALDSRADEREKKREKKRPVTGPAPAAPLSFLNRMVPYLTALGLLAATVIAVLTFAGDNLVTTRARGDKLEDRITTVERAARHRVKVMEAIHAGVKAIARKEGVAVPDLPQPDLLPESGDDHD